MNNLKSLVATFILLSILVVGSQSCYYDKYEDLNPKDTTKNDSSATCDTANVTYSGKIKPIFEASCVSCHSATGSGTSPLMANYADAKSAVQGNVLVRIQLPSSDGLFMPQGGAKLSDCNISLLKAWKNQGYKQ